MSVFCFAAVLIPVTVKVWKYCASGCSEAADTVTLPADKPTKTGYNFAGWKDETAGEDAETFKAGAEYLMGSDDVTLTAQWNRRNSGGGAPSGGGSAATEYAVTVKSADNGTVAVSPKNAEKGDTVTITVLRSGETLDLQVTLAEVEESGTQE